MNKPVKKETEKPVPAETKAENNKSAQESVKLEVKKAMITGIRGITPTRWLFLLCLLAIVFAVLSLLFWVRARSTGERMGEAAGTQVGRAIGSLDGLTRGQLEGSEAGKAEGLSAKDTTADICGKVREVEKLEVLIASGTFSDVLSIGTNPVDYAALLSMKYHAVFTVDLETADITLREDGLHILLDPPEAEFIPVGEIEKRNEFQRPGFLFERGSAEAGYIATDNALNRLRPKAQERLQNDEALIESAKASAVTQLTQLVHAVSLTNPPVIVSFRGGVIGE